MMRVPTALSVWQIILEQLDVDACNTVLVDAACATGDVACMADQQGFQVYALDSSALITIAQQRFQHTSITWQAVPAHSWQAAHPVSLVLGLGGLINQYTTPASLQAALSHWANWLAPQGRIILEVVLAEECRLWSQQANLVTSTADLICFQVREYGPSGYLAQQNRTWFYHTAHGWQRGQDQQALYAYTVQELQAMFTASNLAICKHINLDPLAPDPDTARRAVYILQAKHHSQEG